MLLVGVDSDQKIRHRKGKSRPRMPQEHRARAVADLPWVDAVVVKSDDWRRWQPFEWVLPDVLVVSDEHYAQEELDQLTALCVTLVVLHRQDGIFHIHNRSLEVKPDSSLTESGESTRN